MTNALEYDRRMSERIIVTKLQNGRRLNAWELEYLESHGLKDSIRYTNNTDAKA